MRQGRTVIISEGQKDAERACGKTILTIVYVIFLVVIPAAWLKTEIQAYDNVAPTLSMLSSDRANHVNPNQHIHFTSRSVAPSQQLVDPDFGLSFSKAFSLKRVAEFCQWTEHHNDETTKHSDGTETTRRTYYYIKGWHSHPITSIMFDQPIAHHNPIRNPLPSSDSSVVRASAGDFELTEPFIRSLIEHSSHKRATFMGAVRLDGTAAAGNQFKYIGDGYFYSAHTESTLLTVAKLVGRAAEGSLDFQLGELFGTCTPGDIRIHFEVLEPASLSIVGKVGSTAASGLVQLEPIIADNKYRVSLAIEGEMDANSMFQYSIRTQYWQVLLLRVLMVILLIVAHRKDENLFIRGLCSAAVVLGLGWFMIWSMNVTNIAMIALGAAGHFLLPRNAAYSTIEK